MYRPQFPMLEAPEGFVWQPCMYQYDPSNTPAFTGIALQPNQQTGHIPLQLDRDAPFLLLGIKIEIGGVNMLIKDPYGNQLMEDFERTNEYASDVPPFTVLEGPGIMCLPGGSFEVRLQGQ